MRDRPLIFSGLLVFLVLITFPIWYNLVMGRRSEPPKPVLPDPKIAKQCVAATSYMRGSHMEMLITWRDHVARKNERVFSAADGKTYTMSLTKTCMKCHTSKADFCDKCHDYVAVKPYCWDCHIAPELVRADPGIGSKRSKG